MTTQPDLDAHDTRKPIWRLTDRLAWLSTVEPGPSRDTRMRILEDKIISMMDFPAGSIGLVPILHVSLQSGAHRLIDAMPEAPRPFAAYPSELTWEKAGQNCSGDTLRIALAKGLNPNWIAIPILMKAAQQRPEIEQFLCDDLARHCWWFDIPRTTLFNRWKALPDSRLAAKFLKAQVWHFPDRAANHLGQSHIMQQPFEAAMLELAGTDLRKWSSTIPMLAKRQMTAHETMEFHLSHQGLEAAHRYHRDASGK